MSKSLVHILIPNTTQAACGVPACYHVSYARSAITCKNCKKTEWYKQLPVYNNKTKKR